MRSANETAADPTVLRVSGMTCSACVRGVSNALARVAGAMRVEVDLDTGRAVVHGAPDPEALIEALARIGYEARRADKEADQGTGNGRRGCCC